MKPYHVQIEIRAPEVEALRRQRFLGEAGIDQDVSQLVFGLTRHAQNLPVQLLLIAEVSLAVFAASSDKNKHVTNWLVHVLYMYYEMPFTTTHKHTYNCTSIVPGIAFHKGTDKQTQWVKAITAHTSLLPTSGMH